MALQLPAKLSERGLKADHARAINQLIEAVLADHPELQLRQSWQLWPGEVAGAGDGFYAALLERQG